jgi:hypothetical protein
MTIGFLKGEVKQAAETAPDEGTASQAAENSVVYHGTTLVGLIQMQREWA